MIKLEELLREKQILDLNINVKSEDLGREYRRRADVNINLYLTKFVLEEQESSFYSDSVEDYKKAIELFKKANAGDHLAEGILAYANAIKEGYLPINRDDSFFEYEKQAKKQYEECVEVTLNSNNLRYYFFSMLEQMNLKTRKKVWEKNLLPKRVIIFHSLKSPLSHQVLQGVYYFAHKNHVEVWEYNYGRIPASDKNEKFIRDRLLDASGAVFLCSPEYNKEREIISFEIQNTLELKRINDPLAVFVLDLGNSETSNEFNGVAAISVLQHFEPQIEDFLKNLKDIYYCRKQRCQARF
jgi:hypothetical protein